MKKLFLSCMLMLMCAVMAHAGTGIYLRGNLNGWSPTPEYEFQPVEGHSGYYFLPEVTLDAGGGWKIGDDSWRELDYGAGSVNPGEWVELTWRGSNCNVPVTYTGPIYFRYPQAAVFLGVPEFSDPVEPDPNPDPTPLTMTVYFDMYGSDWTGTPYCHHWSDTHSTQWPGEPMSRYQGTVYSITIPYGSNVVFNDYYGKGQQTNDIYDAKPDHVYTSNSEDHGLISDYDFPVSSDPTPDPDPVTGLSGTLPVLYINVYDANGNLDNAVTSRDLADKNYRAGKYWLDVNGCQWLIDLGAESLGSADEPLDLEIKARGNYTRTGFSKKPFKLKLGTKQKLLGMGTEKSKHWAILAHADDTYGYLRNFVGFNLGKRMGLPWVPSQQPIEVVINGNYRGLYFLTESIRVGDGRVPIQELKDECTDPTLASGGYLVELDNYDEPDESQIRMYEQSCSGMYTDMLRITFDSPEVYSPLQRRFVNEQFSTMNDAVGRCNNSNDLWAYMDLDDAARYYVIEEIVSHTESYHGSTYLFRDRGEGSKWHFSPLWDFGQAFNGPTNDFFYRHAPYGTTWIHSMRCNDKFNAKVSEYWRWFMSNVYDGIMTDIDTYVDHIYAAAQSDYDRWHNEPLPSVTNSNNPSPVVDNRDMYGRRDDVKRHLNAKISWLQSQSQFGTYGSNEPLPTPDDTPAAPLPEYVNPDLTPSVSTSGTLPVVNILTTDGASIGYGDEGKVTAIIAIDPLDTGEDALDGVATEIKGRGDSWFTCDKKAYKLKLDKKNAVLGMTSSKHWVLMPYTADAAHGLLSNYTGHLLSTLAGLPWTPDMRPVELTINGKYLGLYFIAENVRADKTRVPVIDKGDKGHVAGQDWLLEFSNTADENIANYAWTDTHGTHRVVSEAPEFTDDKFTADDLALYQPLLEAGVEAIRSAVAKAAAGTDDSWKEVIDLDRAARFYVVQELMDCADAYSKDFYMYHTSDSKWMTGPVWNFDSSFASEGSKTSLIHKRSDFDGVFIADLYANVDFRDYAIRVFQTLLGNGAQAKGARLAAVGTFDDVAEAVSALGTRIADAIAFDATAWPDYSATVGAADDLVEALAGNIAYLAKPLGEGGAGWNLSETGVENVSVIPADHTDTPVETFDLLGRPVTAPTTGLVIERCGTIVNKRVVR